MKRVITFNNFSQQEVGQQIVNVNMNKLQKKIRDKIMKRLILSFIALLLLFTACDKKCLLKRPKNVQSIDWENYNDVYTVYWNYHAPCENFPMKDNLKNTIMISGWIFQGKEELHTSVNLKNGFTLIDKKENIFKSNASTNGVEILVETHSAYNTECIDSLSIAYIDSLNKTDITRKCFIKGKVGFNHLNMGLCCRNTAIIFITDFNDIYFE